MVMVALSSPQLCVERKDPVLDAGVLLSKKRQCGLGSFF